MKKEHKIQKEKFDHRLPAILVLHYSFHKTLSRMRLSHMRLSLSIIQTDPERMRSLLLLEAHHVGHHGYPALCSSIRRRLME